MILNVDGVLLGNELLLKRKVNVEIVDGKITHIGNGFDSNGRTYRGIVIPPLVNAHVHAGDFAFPEYYTEMTIRELVGDPDSVKYKLLQSAGERVVEFIQEFLDNSMKYGVLGVIDFREQGTVGLELARRVKSKGKYLFLSRIEEGERVQDVVDAHGVGISTAFSYGRETLVRLRDVFSRKIRAVHISETKRLWLLNDLEYALQVFEPNLIIHGTYLGKDEILTLRERRTPIVTCPRSNLWFRVGIPNMEDLFEGFKVLIGTDNGGWLSPNLWRDMELALLLRKRRGEETSKEILKAATVNAYDLVNFSPVDEGGEATFVIVNDTLNGIDRAKDVYTALVKRGESVMSVFIKGEETFRST
ncbi:hypothetical protein HS7_02930 [Sulfolobales archaeon HS-7]|nr:hypothetical protein HS7_02930 [Sulfolobales archaeon HS-7]